MLLIKYLLCLGKIHIKRRLFFPGKARDKIQIIIEHTVLMAVAALLLHAV